MPEVWYQSPPNSYVWSWSTFTVVTGSNVYGTGYSATGSFGCSNVEAGNWGVGCSNGGGAHTEVLPYNSCPAGYPANDPVAGTSCNSPVLFPNICQPNVQIYERRQ